MVNVQQLFCLQLLWMQPCCPAPADMTTGLVSGTVLTCGKDNLLKTVNPQTFEVRQSFRAPHFTVGTIWCTACMSPDGQHVAAGSGNGSVFVWNVSRQTSSSLTLVRVASYASCFVSNT